MRRFTRRTFIQDKKGYLEIIRDRDEATRELEKFIKEWVAPAKQGELDQIIRLLIYTHQQSVSYQTEHEVEEADIRTY